MFEHSPCPEAVRPLDSPYRALLSEYLPACLWRKADINRLEVMQGYSVIDEPGYNDMLFSIPTPEDPLFVYMVTVPDHNRDPTIRSRIKRCLEAVRQKLQIRFEKRGLPLIYPLILHSGPGVSQQPVLT